MASRLCVDINRIYSSYVNRFGGNGKLVMLTFVWAPVAGGILSATPDGRLAGVPVAHSITPQSMAMTKGITVAMNSCTSLPFELFNGGAFSGCTALKSLTIPYLFEDDLSQIFRGVDLSKIKISWI